MYQESKSIMNSGRRGLLYEMLVNNEGALTESRGFHYVCLPPNFFEVFKDGRSGKRTEMCTHA